MQREIEIRKSLAILVAATILISAVWMLLLNINSEEAQQMPSAAISIVV